VLSNKLFCYDIMRLLAAGCWAFLDGERRHGGMLLVLASPPQHRTTGAADWATYQASKNSLCIIIRVVLWLRAGFIQHILVARAGIYKRLNLWRSCPSCGFSFRLYLLLSREEK